MIINAVSIYIIQFLQICNNLEMFYSVYKGKVRKKQQITSAVQTSNGAFIKCLRRSQMAIVNIIDLKTYQINWR